MARVYYFALVDKEDSTFDAAFARHDENLRGFNVSQQEGDFCGLSVLIEQPTQALLDPTRKQWAWLSVEEGTILTPLFFGRVVGIPADIQGDFVTVDFLAKPYDFDAQKRTLAATLKAAPFWDYAFIDPQMWDDPDAVMEARTDVWHIDRVTNAVTISSIISGEDGSLEITEDLIPEQGFSLSYRDAPLRKVNLEMRAMWTQKVTGSLDITRDLLDAFRAAGSPSGFVTSYTGQGLYDDWPEEGDNIGNVYEFGPQTIDVADGTALPRKYKTVSVNYDRAPTTTETTATRPMKVDFRRWGFTIQSFVNYDVSIDRTEDISFSVFADVQNVVNDADDEQSDIITMSSGNIGIEVGQGSAVEIPIGDVARDRFFPTTRGLLAVEFGLAHARALLLRRARAVEIKVQVPFATGIEATCRKSATVYHPGLPGGVATGKVVAYEFGVDGDSGAETATLTIACMAGNDTTLVAEDGLPTYADAEYVGSDYQVFTGRTVIASPVSMLYSLPDSDPIASSSVGLTSVTVSNGETAQKSVLSSRYIDIDAACDALNEAATEVDLVMTPLDTSPRETSYYSTSVTLSIAQGVDLGVAI